MFYNLLSFAGPEKHRQEVNYIKKYWNGNFMSGETYMSGKEIY